MAHVDMRSMRGHWWLHVCICVGVPARMASQRCLRLLRVLCDPHVLCVQVLAKNYDKAADIWSAGVIM